MPSLSTFAAHALGLAGLLLLTGASAHAQSPAMTPEAINSVSLTEYLAESSIVPDILTASADPSPVQERTVASPALARLQILLDRAGASPGVIDGFDGGNLHKAILAFQMMHGLPLDGRLTPEVAARLDSPGDAIGIYTITPDDVGAIGGPIPKDYAEKAALSYLGYERVPELLAERFHMDIGLLSALNPDAEFSVGEIVNIALTGPKRKGAVTWIEADTTLEQVRVYGVNGVLLAAYPATIGSDDTPSPSGTHTVKNATTMPGYTYNPKINFQQGDNTGVLTIPPGPNGPVGSVWIALSKPSFGTHGTPEPAQIGKTGSHGCIRLTNWDAEELAAMITSGVTVDFL